MKNSGSTGCCYLCYCYWSTILFVASSVVCVSPESSATRYPNQEQQQQQQQQKQQQQLVLQLEHQEARTSSASIDWPQNIDSSDIYHTKLVPTDELTIMLVQSAPKITVNSKSKIFAPNASTLYERNGKSESDVLVAAQRQSKIQFAPNYLNSNARTSSPIAAVSSISSASTTAVSASDHNFPLSQWQQYKSDMALFSIDKDTPTTLRSRRARQVADGEQMDKCRLFVEGELDKNEIYSPDYPNDYPKNINCTRIITAPKGQIIRLDFRNSFHIEAKEECKFDFLEIRDGQYGFSNLIGKYCGTDFPPEITSKERYLWLHFHSDESIEYSGFTAIYEFIDRNREAPSTDLNCTIEKDGYEGFINSTDVPQEIRETVIKNKIPLDCMWRIQVQDKWKIQVKFLDFKLSKPNDCETNFLDIFPEQTVMPLRVKNFCGSAGEGITSDSNILHMRFYAEQIAINSTFSILYTAFRDRGSAACIEEIEYDCEDATCISQELRCNGRDNCKFRWDEESCTEESTGQSEHVVIIIIVFGLILGGMVITFLVNCIRKIMRDQKIIRDVPALRNGIYHIDSIIMGAPKAAIFVGLQNDYMFEYNLKDGIRFDHDTYSNSDYDNGCVAGCGQNCYGYPTDDNTGQYAFVDSVENLSCTQKDASEYNNNNNSNNNNSNNNNNNINSNINSGDDNDYMQYSMSSSNTTAESSRSVGAASGGNDSPKSISDNQSDDAIVIIATNQICEMPMRRESCCNHATYYRK